MRLPRCGRLSKDSTDVRALEAYRRQYGPSNPFYDHQAERRIDELKQQQAALAPPPLFSLREGRSPRSRAEERALKPKDSFKECDTCPEMVVVPAGSFMMGSPESEEGRLDSEGPQHQVTIARPFAVGKFEVTFAEWDACVAGGGCAGNKCPIEEGWGRGKRPVINVSWDDAKEYAGVAVAQDRQDVPAADGGGVGVCGAWRDERIGAEQTLLVG